jgi:hypothetical protein
LVESRIHCETVSTTEDLNRGAAQQFEKARARENCQKEMSVSFQLDTAHFLPSFHGHWLQAGDSVNQRVSANGSNGWTRAEPPQRAHEKPPADEGLTTFRRKVRFS